MDKILNEARNGAKKNCETLIREAILLLNRNHGRITSATIWQSNNRFE